jgi:hypothetical protein
LNRQELLTTYNGNTTANQQSSPRGRNKEKSFGHNHPDLHSVAMATDKEAKEKEIQKLVELMHKNQSETAHYTQ